MSAADYSRLNKKRYEIPGSSKISDSESDDLSSLPTKKRKYVSKYSSDSDSSNPPVKVSDKSITQLKDLLLKYHSEVLKNNVERQVQSETFLYSLFSCLICRDVVQADAAPVIPNCCRAAPICTDCLQRWIETQPTCPHCREDMLDVETGSSPFPILRPLFDFLSKSAKVHQ